jgi:hypothetical protein
MGPRKLNEIKQELRQLLGKNQELVTWLEQEITRPESKSAPARTVTEDLLWVRELLGQTTTKK